MRIAQLVLSGQVSGGQLVALTIARAASARGDEVVFLSPSRGPFTELVESEGLAVLDVRVGRALDVSRARPLARLLKRERIDLLHTHGAFAVNNLGRVAARLAGVPVVSHLHIENYLRPGAVGMFQRTVDNATARLCARVIAVSEQTRRALERQGYPAGRIVVIANGIELPGETPPVELGLPRPVVGEIARLAEVKGQHDLIEALRELPGVHAVFAGEDLEQGGAYRRQLEREAGDRVRFLGYRDDVPAIIEALDVLVLPSWIEGLPLVVLEAMAHSKPVVATDVGGTAEAVVDGETGLLVPPRDPPALAAAIRRLLDDPEAARRMGEAGRRRVEERFSAEAMSRRVLEIYDEVARAD